eukprot:4903124-Prymnesium_polylepis.1
MSHEHFHTSHNKCGQQQTGPVSNAQNTQPGGLGRGSGRRLRGERAALRERRRHLVLAAMLRLEVVAHRVGRHHQRARRALHWLRARGARVSRAPQSRALPDAAGCAGSSK